MESSSKSSPLHSGDCGAQDDIVECMEDLKLSEDLASDDASTNFGEEYLLENPYHTLADLEEEEAIEDNVKAEEKSVAVKQKEPDPRLKELSKINAQVNKMRIDKLKKQLRHNGLDCHGTKAVLQKRLKAFYSRKEFKDCKENEMHYEYFLVIDFEATCDEKPNNFRNEIIEFPAVLVSTKKKKIIGKFHSYVRPMINPKLTTFCTNLTGITQDQVNNAPTFPEVKQKFEAWMKQNKLKDDLKCFAIVTDGPWDMGRFMYHQCKISKVSYPRWAKTWINIKKPFSNFYSIERATLQIMLTKLGMTFIGQPHSGLDDSLNIARVAMQLSEDGANMRVNEQICFKKPRNLYDRLRTFRNINKNEFSAMLKRRNVDPPSDEEEEEEYDDPDVIVESGEEDSKDDHNYEEEFPSLISKPQVVV